MAPAIEVRDVWKLYHFGRLGYGSLRHDLQSWWARLRGREDPNQSLVPRASDPEGSGAEGEAFWALRGVSLSIEPGEVVGIVGRNGAGKSTLLKILSRVTAPTRGEARLRGRVASLLEVGTGFHPELTGRENVFLNGAILGMSRAEVARKFESIVEFAGLRAFVDTPVKRYSSGMYVRLAFAVAAHLEPEILLVDEVLAVGDLEFQKRCLGRLAAIASEGRTVLFVSHNLGAVSNLCPRALLLSGGELACHGATEEVLRRYMSEGSRRAESRFEEAPAGAEAWLVEAAAEPDEGNAESAPVGSPITVRLLVGSRARLEGVELSLRVERQDGQRVFTTSYSDATGEALLEEGLWRYSLRIPGSFLAPGTYFGTVGIHRPNVEMLALYEQALSFTIVETGSDLWKYRATDYGVVLLRAPWSKRRAEGERSGRLGPAGGGEAEAGSHGAARGSSNGGPSR